MTAQPIEIRSIPLNKLQLSPRNVRTQVTSVDDLIASIRAHGLEQNLVVVQSDAGFEVVAGGRRLRALQALQAEGLFQPAELVPCKVLPAGADPEEASLAENSVRESMHPADEFTAFRRLIEQECLSVDEIAARFGRPVRYIEQRLKLANLSPAIIGSYRAGELNLGQVVALSITEDHGEQERVWADAQKKGPHAQEPSQLRRALTTKELSVETDAVAAFLGVADYEAGGGQARKDLFGSERAAWLPDPKLASRLAMEKLRRSSQKVTAEGWSWVEVSLEFGYEARAKFKVYGAGPYDYVDTAQKVKWPAEARTIGGAMLTVSSRGEVVVHRGLVRPADMKKAKAPAPGKKSLADPGKKVSKKPGALSFAQVQRLQGDRTAVLRRTLAEDPRRALAALAADLARDQDLVSGSLDTKVMRISGERHFSIPANIRDTVEQHPSTKQLETIEAAWRKRLQPAKGRLFEWLLEQPEEVTHQLLAVLAARSVVAGEAFDNGRDRGASFAVAAGIDMAQHWEPTVQWLQAQPKDVIQMAVREACGSKAEADVSKLQKSQAAARAAELLRGTGWVPKTLRAPEKERKRVPAKGKKAAAGDIE